MAISFSRPDPASPAAVGSAGFTQARRGYDPGEVRDFLRMVAAELARLQERERFLESEMRAMQTRGMSSPGRLDEETVTTLLGEEAARVLAAARDASVQIRDRAEESATQMVKEAASDATRIREAAALDAQRIREEAATDAEAELELAKQQGRDMVVEAREYREKVLTELARRRDAARAQIDKLLQDRERLLTAFGRAKASSEEALVSLADSHEEPEPFITISMPPERARVNPNHPSVTPAIYDRATEDALPSTPPRHVMAPPPVTTPRDPEQGRNSPDSVAVAEEPSVTDASHGGERSTRSEMPEVTEVSEVTEVIVNDGTEDAAVDVEYVEAEIAEPETHDTDHAESRDDGELAQVVELFGGDRRSAARPDPEPAVADGPDPDPTSAVSDAGAIDAANRGDTADKVDVIFARLRAASVEVVSAAATDTIATRKIVTTPSVAPTTSSSPTPVAVLAVSDPALFAARDGALGPIVDSLGRRLKRAMMDEQNDVLEHLGQRRSSLDPEAMVGGRDARSARYLAAIGSDVMAAAAEGARSMKPHGGSTKRVTSAALDESVATALHERALAPLQGELERAVADADGDRSRIGEAVRAMFREWKARFDDVAADLAHLAHARGAYLSLETATEVRWMTHPDGSACSDCADNALAGAMPSGERFPTGDVHPGAHAGCRCLLGPAHH